jgi:hypothetical protein
MYSSRPIKKVMQSIVHCCAPIRFYKNVILGLVFFGLSHGTSAQEKVGFVLDLRGTWTVSGNSVRLTRGEAVPGGAMIRNGSTKPSDNDRIVVADLKGDIIKRVRCKSGVCNECRDSGVCYDPIQQLPESTPQTGIITASFRGLMELFSSKPEQYSLHRVRGKSLPDGIAQVSNDLLDLSSIIKTQQKGSYFLTLRQIPTQGSSNIWKLDRLSFDWDPLHPERLFIRGIHTGLYEATLEWTGSETSFWILITSAQPHEEREDDFRLLTSQTESWGNDVSEDAKLSYRRACLAYLANRLEVKR